MAHYHLDLDLSLTLRHLSSPMGGRMLQDGSDLTNEIGLENFTFKELAERMGSTKVTVYNFFANKQRLLQYYFQLYWLWLGIPGEQNGKAATDTLDRLHSTIRALAGLWPGEVLAAQLVPSAMRKLVINEGSGSFMHKNVDSEKELKLFKPYKDLCAQVATELKACSPRIKSPRSFATTLVEMAHSLESAMLHLPALTGPSGKKDRKQLAAFLTDTTDRYLGVK